MTDRYLNGIPSDSRIRTDGRFLKEQSVQDRLAQIQELNQIAARRGQTLAQMALSWVLKDAEVTSVLIGASKPSQIEENIKIVQKTEFSEEELAEIDRISLN